MKSLLSQIVFMTAIILNFGQISNKSNKFNLQSSLVYHNCQDQDQNSVIIGSDLVKGQTSVTTDSLMIKGWFLVRNYDVNAKTLFSVHSVNSVLFNYMYRISDASLDFDFFGAQYSEKSIISKDLWFFTYISINLDRLSNKIQSFLGILRQTSSILKSMEADLNGLNLDLNNLIFNLGSGSSSLNITPSCSISKDIQLYQNYPFIKYQMNSFTQDQQSKETVLYYYFNFFAIKLTSGILQSQALKKGQVNFISSQQSTNEFQSKQVMKLPVINLNELGSIILTFDALLVDMTQSVQCQIFSILLTSLDRQYDLNFKMYFKQPNSLFVEDQSLPLWTNILTQWTQINVSLISFLKSQINIWPQKDYDYSLFQQNLSTLFSQAIFQFGSDQNNCKFKVDNIRLYAGHYLQETDTCLLQAGEQKQECIRCKDGYLLDQSDQNMTCTNIGTPSEIYYQKQYLKKQCPINMYYFNSKCQCLKGFYLEGQTCLRCPQNCLDCTSFNSCNNINYQRDSTGKCINDTFDDGFSCITPIPLIEVKDITFFKFKELNYNFDLYCKQDLPSDGFTYQPNVNLQPSQSFFYSFQIKYNANSGKSPLSVFKMDGNESITIVGEGNMVNSYIFYYMCVLINGDEVAKLQVQKPQIFWVGVWTNFNDHIIILHQNGQTIYKQITNKKIVFSKFDPSVCVGICISIYYLKYLCTIIPLPLLIVNGMPNPLKFGIENIFLYHSQDKQLKAKYIYDGVTQDKLQIMDTNRNAAYTMSFSTPIPQISKTKGIGFSNKQQGSIESLETIGFITFQSQIQVEKIENQSLLLQYSIDSLTVRYFLFPDEFQKYISFRICMNEVCRDSKYVKIEISKPSSLIIIPKNKTPFEKLIRIIDFEVICNKQRESITLLYEHQFDIDKKTDTIRLSQSSQDEYLYFLNFIQFYESGNFFQIEYKESEGCFVYMNINPMICIQIKPNFYHYQSKLIPYQECQNLNEISQYFYFPNPYTQKCELTNILINKCKEIDFDGQFYYCKKCKDPYAIINSDPIKSFLCNECQDGYFLSGDLDKCLVCHSKCSKCTKSFDNCTECAHDMQLIPTCECILPHYYLETDYECYECDDKCESCVQLKTYCIACSENRIYPPLCSCKPGYLENSITNQCDKINCDQKCLTCVDNSLNCDMCAQNRIEPPLCKCGQNYYEDSKGDCQQCPQYTYYDLENQSCKKCLKVCAECVDQADNCISCLDGFVLFENKCYCNSNTIPYVKQNGEPICLNQMNLKLIVKFNNNIYSLTFVLEEELLDIDFKQYQISDILSVYLSITPNEAFLIQNPRINGKEFSVDLIMLKNIQTQQGNVQFHMNYIFISKSEEYALSDYYNYNPIVFNIGPLIFTEEVLYNQQLDTIYETIKNSNQSLLDFVERFQFVFYILNTLQPTMLFFLLKLNYPPNLYKFFQIVATFIFSKIPDYQSHQPLEQYQLFKYSFNIDEVKPGSQFSQFGFSDCLIINCPIIIIKYAVIMFGLFIGFIFTKILNIQKLYEVGQIIIIKLFDRINIENEVNLLTLVLSLMIQFTSVNSNSLMNRLSDYISMIIAVILIITFLFNFYQINNNKKQPSQYSSIFTERLNNRKGKLIRNYFIFQLIKKYFLIVIVFVLYSYPFYVCALSGMVFLVSSISTAFLKPYRFKIQRIIKIFGEFILSFIWFFNIYIVNLENKLFKNNIIDDDLVSSYLKAGNVVIISLLIYNSIYILEFFYSILQKIKDTGKPQYNNNQQNNYKPIILKNSKPPKQNSLFKIKKVKFRNPV